MFLSSRIITRVSVLALVFHASQAFAQDSDQSAALDQLSEAAESSGSALATAAGQEAEGDVLGAASTLERALLHRPEADDVRLAYATLLCKLDDRESARIEVGALRLRPTAGDAWGQMIEACGADFDQISRRTGRIGGSVTAGLAYQEDAFGEISAFSFSPPLSRDGMAFVANAQINARVPAGSAFLYGDLFAQTHNDISGPDADYQFGDLALGIGTENGHSEFSGGGVIRQGRIAGDEYFTAYGGEAAASFRIGGNGRISLRGEAVKEDYFDDSQDGWHYSAQASYQFFPTLEHSFMISASYEAKDADVRMFGYDAFGVAGVAKVPLSDGGLYGKLSASLRHLDFRDEDTFENRREWRLYSRAALGVPLIGRSLFVEAAGTYRRRDYSLAFVDDYASWGGDLKLVWNF